MFKRIADKSLSWVGTQFLTLADAQEANDARAFAVKNTLKLKELLGALLPANRFHPLTMRLGPECPGRSRHARNL